MSTPSIIVVHGALGSAAQMQPIGDALSTLGAVHLLELPGHGTRALADGASFSMETFAHALGDVVAEQSLSRPIVFGYSMGGYAALLLESMLPGTLGGIMTLGTKVEWTPAVADAAASRLDAGMIQSKVPKFAEQLRVRHEQAGGWEQLLARTAALLYALGANPPLNDASLARVLARVRVCAGANDDTLADGETERTAARLSNATAHLFADVAHPIERVPVQLVVDGVSLLLRDQSRSP